MITYRKGWAGLGLACQVVGTAWPLGIVPGLMSCAVGIVLMVIPELEEFISDDERFLKNHYPFQLFSYLVGFFMVFRTNFAYRRYWLSLDAVQRMSAKWLDGALMCVAFDAHGSTDLPYLQAAVGGESGAKATDSADAASGPAGMSHSEFFTQVCHLFSLLHALALQHFRGDKNLENLQEICTDGAQPRISLVGRGDGHLSQKWRPGFSFSERSLDEKFRAMKLNVIGSLSKDEEQALLADSRGRPLLGEARVTMVCGWVTRRMIARQKHEPMGDMCKTAAPVLARIYQVLSDGMLAFSQASMTATIPFPFPYHNLTQTFLWIYAFTVPFVVNAKIEHPVLRVVINFFAVWAYFALAAVGDNLEDPYLPYDPNDLPLTVMQHQFNAQLVTFGVVPEKSSLQELRQSLTSLVDDDSPDPASPQTPTVEKKTEAAAAATMSDAAAAPAAAAQKSDASAAPVAAEPAATSTTAAPDTAPTVPAPAAETAEAAEK